MPKSPILAKLSDMAKQKPKGASQAGKSRCECYTDDLRTIKGIAGRTGKTIPDVFSEAVAALTKTKKQAPAGQNQETER